MKLLNNYFVFTLLLCMSFSCKTSQSIDKNNQSNKSQVVFPTLEDKLDRKVVYRDLDMIKYATSEDGVIVFEICIARDGSVSNAQIDESRTTITDATLLKNAVKILYNYKYEPDLTAPEEQCGQYALVVQSAKD